MAPRYDDDRGDSPDFQSPLDGFRRMDARLQLLVVALIALAAVAFAAAYLKFRGRPQQSSSSGSPQMLLGNPSGATDDSSNRDNYLMVKPYFALSYNDSKGTPNWVSWQVTAADLGKAPRKPTFDPDRSLPGGFHQVTMHDYDRSGFDRGHMCPHSDRAGNQEMSYATFVMTNIIPQAPNVNRKAWEHLESYGRELVRRNNRLYIIAGPAGQGGRGSMRFMEKLPRGNVVVPASCWKIVVVVPAGGGEDDLAKVTAGTRVIAVIMPNDQSQVGEDWAKFRTNAAEIERVTGLHFFERVRADVASALREKVDDEAIPRVVSRDY
jgi:endonuclease G